MVLVIFRLEIIHPYGTIPRTHVYTTHPNYYYVPPLTIFENPMPSTSHKSRVFVIATALIKREGEWARPYSSIGLLVVIIVLFCYQVKCVIDSEAVMLPRIVITVN